MLLTGRAEDIIRILIRFPQDNPVTTAMISEELNISSRSIQRELPGVEQWLAAEGYRFAGWQGTYESAEETIEAAVTREGICLRAVFVPEKTQ